MKAAPLKATITLREDLTPSLARFEFALEGGVPDFKPGQFLTIGLPHPGKEGKTLWRPYSISSKPEQKDCMELYIRLAERPVPGLFTTMLWKLGVGDVMDFKDPKGAFLINHSDPDGSPETRRLIMIGGGTGVAPFVSMIGSLKDAGCNREIILCQGASYQQELGYRDYLEGLAAESDANGHKDWNFHYLPSISRPDEEANAGWAGHTGRVESLIVPGEDGLNAAERVAGEHFTPENASFYICGFGAIVDSICDTVKARGFVARKDAREDGSYDIRFESYG
ncbi:MAG: FAD-binding oxidoreductase [Planctomycetota bacterium]|nr:FAD-binding oxidoreductase [Planctomycetota bacterium]MDA1114585.1 FAD-binding oxidoreductase [Planctomycetota bacterium]